MNRVLIIGNNWPEPSSTAAGTRMMQIIKILQEDDNFHIHFCCAAPFNEYSTNLVNDQIVTHFIELNNSSFDQLLEDLQPDLVIYDRFYIEEQYGWRVNQACPEAKTILDTEDLHFLRKARQRAVKDQVVMNASYYNHPDAYREIASILRCDLSLIISSYEMDLLVNEFQIPADRLFYLPILVDTTQNITSRSSFDQTQDFISIGNFMHAPNEDAVWQLKKYIWPELRKQLPKARLHIYGSYCKEKHYNWHNEKEGFLVHGRADLVSQAFYRKRILLAPLRYGAGLKGKIFDAIQYGVPVVTTAIGAEGIFNNLTSKYFIAQDNSDFIEKAVQLYSDPSLWEQSRREETTVLRERFNYSAFAKAFIQHIHSLNENKSTNENAFSEKLLNYHSYQHLKFKSKWIEEKEKHKKSDFN